MLLPYSKMLLHTMETVLKNINNGKFGADVIMKDGS